MGKMGKMGKSPELKGKNSSYLDLEMDGIIIIVYEVRYLIWLSLVSKLLHRFYWLICLIYACTKPKENLGLTSGCQNSQSRPKS